ncbi:MAG: glycosyltransferase family 4 protein, partial [Acidobacteriota bacterium]|nr:glycosyltransferase family 4 protein [Acidobacteriota bacterium]
LLQRAKAEGFDVDRLGLFFPKCDLVHAHDARSHTLALRLRPPLVVSRRVAFPIRSRSKYRGATHFIAVSDYVANVLKSGGVPESKISVVPDGVPLLRLTAAGEKILIPAQKQTPLAVEAARLTGLPVCVSEDLEADLANARFLLYATECEGLGSGVLLAMSAGVPAIASNVGGLREIIVDGENGLLVENSVEAIASAVRRLAGNPDLAGRIAVNARLTIETRFSEARMVADTIEVYRRVLNA